MTLASTVSAADSVIIRQKKELQELLGIEGKNKYSIQLPDGKEIGFAAEEGGGALDFIMRQFLGHCRSFSIKVVNPEGKTEYVADHPFRLLMQRLEIRDDAGALLGAVQQRFSLVSKNFDVLDADGATVMTVKSGLFKPWTFPFKKGEDQVAAINKKWSGIGLEAFTDADSFQVLFTGKDLSERERILVLLAGLFVDLQYFEKKSS